MKSPIKSSSVENEVMVIALQGSLEITVQKSLRDQIEKLCHEQGDVVLDFRDVSFIDSSCLGVLVSISRNLRDKKSGDLKIAELKDEVRSIFQITRLDRVFQVFETVSEAAESYFK